MADIDLPVFPFRVNWSNGVLERIGWLTDVLPAVNGNEQRQALRLSPRREFEATLTLFEQERTFADLWLHRMVEFEMMVPVWHEATAADAYVEGATVVGIDTRYLSFQEGGLAIILGKDAFSHEVMEIVSIEADSLEFTTGVKRGRRGARIAPLIRGRLGESSSVNRVTPKAAECQVRLDVTVPNDYVAGEWPGDIYLDLPVLTDKPDFAKDQDFSYIWDMSELDGQRGDRYRLSDQRRALVASQLTYLKRGRRDKHYLRQQFYRQEGRLGGVWLPTWNHDLVPYRDIPAGAFLDVKACGYGYTGGPTSGREHIMIVTKTGTYYRKVLDTAVAGIAEYEKLILDVALPAIAKADVRYISFMDTARLTSDSVEFSHKNDIDGVMQTQVAYKTYRNSRAPTQPIYYPIPMAEMNNNACGVGSTQCDVDYGALDYWQIDMEWTPTIGGQYPDLLMSAPQAFVGPNGRGVGDSGNTIGLTGGLVWTEGSGASKIARDWDDGFPGELTRKTGPLLATMEPREDFNGLIWRLYQGQPPDADTLAWQIQFSITAYPGGGPSDGGGWPAWIRMSYGGIQFFEQEFTVLRLWPTFHSIDFEYDP